MKIDNEVVKYVAHLARIELAPEELEKLSGQLQGIIDFIGKLKELNVENTSPTNHILPISNVFREDAPKQSLSNNRALLNAPQPQGSFFGVPKVIE